MAASTSTVGTTNGASLSWRLVWGALVVAGVIIITGGLLILNYMWPAVIFLFASLFLLFSYLLEKYQWRNFVLLAIAFVFVAVVAGLLTYNFLEAYPGVILATPPDNNSTALGIALLTGIGAAIILVVIPFLLLVGITTADNLKSHQDGEGVSFFSAYEYTLADLLGIFRVSVTVEDGKVKGDKKSVEHLEKWGGSGRMMVYPGQVVVLHKLGKMTRAVGRGLTRLDRREQIKAILPLSTKGGSNSVDNVSTRDRIPLNITISHAVQLEPAEETRKRLQKAVSEAREKLRNPQDRQERDRLLSLIRGADRQLQDPAITEEEKIKLQDDIDAAEKQLQDLVDKIDEAAQQLKKAQTQLQELESDEIIGDDYDQCYERIAKLAAARAGSDIWESMKGSVATNLRDVVMSCNFDDLFSVSNGNGGLDSNIKKRKIAEIEKLVSEAIKGSGSGKGLVVRGVDISGVKSPEQIEERTIAEATTLAETRIKQTQAQADEATALIKARIVRIEAVAESEALVTVAKARRTAAEEESKATTTIAKAEAEAEYIREQTRAAARALHYKRVIRALKEEEQTSDTISTVVKEMAHSASSEEQWKRLLHITVSYLRGDQTDKVELKTEEV